MPTTHNKEIGVYRRDASSYHQPLLIGEFDSSPEARDFINRRFDIRYQHAGTEIVEIFDKLENLLGRYSIG